MSKMKLAFFIIGIFLSTSAVYADNIPDEFDVDPDVDINVQSRLFQGQFDLDDEFKFHVAILKLHPNETTEIICGGAIIDNHHVLTAAHCIYELQKHKLLVRSGWDIAPKQPHLEKRSYHKVSRIMYPKDYFHSPCRNHQHDLAIIKVERSFDLADESHYKKVNLPEPDNDYENYDVTFTGYGIHKIGKLVNRTTNEVFKEIPLYPTKLKYVMTRVTDNESCKRVAPVILTNGNLCTQPQNQNGFSCLGDNGGPLVHDGVIVGIKNSHNSECLHHEPEIFTRVSAYLGFIQNVLNHEHSYDIVYI